MASLRLRSAAVISCVTVAIGGAATPCPAATLNVLSDFFLIEAGTGTTLLEQNFFYLVPRFNPSLGTLDAIALTVVRGGVVATISVDSESPFSAAVLDGVIAVANTAVSYSGGQLAGISGEVVGPSPGFVLPPDSDGTPDFVGSDAFVFTGLIAASTIDEMISNPATLADFTGPGLLFLTLRISELAGSSIPGSQELQAAYGEGIGAINLAYDYTPASAPAQIPEPWTFALMGLSCVTGVVRAVARGRRLRKAQRIP